jgi:8-oxo-dGTP pyrophosphatase MutT (NUDIX family)/phosphohistidine phosphatase SixA
LSGSSTTPVLAAGAVLWRDGRSGVEVLLITRSRQNDVSLPKGKVDPGEAFPETAVREVREETGYAVGLGIPLGMTEYSLPNGRDKIVYYWAAEVTREQLLRGRFRPNDEVDRIEWVSVAKARKKLTYSRDVDVIDRFHAFVERGDHRTFGLIALRHAKAETDSKDGTDAARPLSSRGRRQAADLVRTIPAWSPAAILSSPARRCVETVTPLAKALKLEVKQKVSLGQDLWEGDDESEAARRLQAHLTRRIERRATTVLCTHSPVLPPLLDGIAAIVGGERDGRLTRSGILSTAEFTVVHLSHADPTHGIIALEWHQPAV